MKMFIYMQNLWALRHKRLYWVLARRLSVIDGLDFPGLSLLCYLSTVLWSIESQAFVRLWRIGGAEAKDNKQFPATSTHFPYSNIFIVLKFHENEFEILMSRHHEEKIDRHRLRPERLTISASVKHKCFRNTFTTLESQRRIMTLRSISA